MATRIEIFHVTVAIGTTASAPQTTALNAPDGVLERIEVKVPAGPSGLVGFRFHHSGQMIIPASNNDYIITDNEDIKWDVEGYPTGNRWTLVAYNLDVYAHALEIRFLMHETPPPRSILVAPSIVEQPDQVTVAVE